MSVLSSTSYTLWSGTVIGGGATLTSIVIDLLHVDLVESLALRVSSVAGTANVRAEFQQSHNGVDWDEEDDNPDITASTLTDKAGNPEGWNYFSMPAILARFVRILIDEISAAILSCIA